MKFFSALFILFSMTSTVSASAADSSSLEDAVLSHSAIQSIYTLLNSSNKSLCAQPKPQDVRVFCFGALPEVTAPTIVANGCGFHLAITCKNGASANISGMDRSYEIIDQNHKVSSMTPVGIIVNDVKLELPSK